MKWLSRSYMALVFFILYAPILIVLLFSFNESESLSAMTGFSFKWYRELFRDDEALSALRNSLILAVSSALTATVLGTLAAFSIYRCKNKHFANAMETVSNIPMMNPDIVTGVSMMLLFVGVAMLFAREDSSLGFGTMLIAHTTFNLPYVILSVLPKFRQMDRNLTEASLDLGCTPLQTFFRVELPSVLSGVISGLMMSFTLSLDDFVISHFVSSTGFVTLPLYIYSQTRKKVRFSMYALCALIVVTILILLISVNVAGSVGEKRQQRMAREKGGKNK